MAEQTAEQILTARGEGTANELSLAQLHQLQTGNLSTPQQTVGSASPLDIQAELSRITNEINQNIQPSLNVLKQAETNFVNPNALPVPTQSIVEQQQTQRSGFFNQIKEFFKPTQPQETAQAQVDRLIPDNDPRITELDTQLANLQTQFQQELDNISQRGETLQFVRGQQERFERQFRLQEQNLLLRRDALVGDFERATERGKLILGIEREQREDEREDRKLALDIMFAEADAQEAVFLTQLRSQLDLEASRELATFEQSIADQDEIQRLVNENQEAFSAHFQSGGSMPKSVSAALSIASQFNAPNIARERGLRERLLEAQAGKAESSGGITIDGFSYDKGDIEKVARATNTPEGQISNLGSDGINYVLNGSFGTSRKEIDNLFDQGFLPDEVIEEIKISGSIPSTIRPILNNYVESQRAKFDISTEVEQNTLEEVEQGFFSKLFFGERDPEGLEFKKEE